MAEFCQQCSEELFDLDSDFKDIGKDKDPKLLYLVICEGCGVIQVNYLGECVSVDCDKRHGEQIHRSVV